LDRFYRDATEILIRHDTIIDKLIGDAVMALFIPGICGPAYRRRAAEAAIALLRTVAYGWSGGSQLPVGAAVSSGLTYVGNVGAEGIVDFTALGDTVNTAARLSSCAAAGEVLMSEAVYADIAGQFPNLEQRTLRVRGKGAPFAARAFRAC
jgi:adenylate cyclase